MKYLLVIVLCIGCAPRPKGSWDQWLQQESPTYKQLSKPMTLIELGRREVSGTGGSGSFFLASGSFELGSELVQFTKMIVKMDKQKALILSIPTSQIQLIINDSLRTPYVKFNYHLTKNLGWGENAKCYFTGCSARGRGRIFEHLNSPASFIKDHLGRADLYISRGHLPGQPELSL